MRVLLVLKRQSVSSDIPCHEGVTATSAFPLRLRLERHLSCSRTCVGLSISAAYDKLLAKAKAQAMLPILSSGQMGSGSEGGKRIERQKRLPI
jgi:hypothetical protein